MLENGQRFVPDMDALAQYFALTFTTGAAFSGIYHLPPGHMARISIEAGLTIERYWDLAAVTPEKNMTEAEAKAGL